MTTETVGDHFHRPGWLVVGNGLAAVAGAVAGVLSLTGGKTFFGLRISRNSSSK